MAGGDVITKGASKRTTQQAKTGVRAGGDVITKGPTKKQSSKQQQNKAGRSNKKRRS